MTKKKEKKTTFRNFHKLSAHPRQIAGKIKILAQNTYIGDAVGIC